LAERLPELYEAQIRGIFEAFIEFDKKEQEECVSAEYEPVARPEILVPTVRNSDELRFVKALTARIASECGLTEEGYTFGSMLETIDACNNIESIAPECDFLSIGSNDLTEEVLYCSRHDFAARNKLMMAHWKNRDPFLTLYDPVIQTIYDAVGRARSVNPDIQVDLCGAHAEDIASLEALRSLNLDGVSVPPTEQNMNTLPLEYNFSTFRKHQDTVNSPLPDNNRAPEI
jgi:phosphoenolpyruvate synthase/pyruvate phosphate dikinase